MNVRKYIYPAVVTSLSIFVLVFLPMLGSDASMQANMPTTKSAWILWATIRVVLCIVNILFLYCFTQQGEDNVSNTEKYIRAMELMGRNEPERSFRSPAKWKAEQYGMKGASTLLTTVLSLFCLSSAVLTYDWVSLITYSLSLLVGIVFGLISMRASEKYWSEEFYNYAIKHYGENTKELEK